LAEPQACRPWDDVDVSDGDGPGASPVGGPPATAEPAGGGRLWPVVWAAVRGCVAGVASIAAVVGVAYAVVPTTEQQPCPDNEVGCLPDFRPIIVAILVMAILMPLLSPLAAWAVRLPTPWWFVLPGLWVDALILVGGIASPVVAVILALAPYGLLGAWVHRRAAKPAPSPPE
jgi:hypothetical protein